MPRLLTEQIDYADSQVDPEGHVIRGVAVLQQHSHNRRRYTPAVIEKSAKVFNEVPVTVRGAHDRVNRDYNSQNGVLRSGRYDSVRQVSLYDWHLNEADELTAKILVDAAKFPGNIPLSVEIGEWQEEQDEDSKVTVITDITDESRYLGVAAVYRGGTNKTIFEEEDPIVIKTLAELRQAHPGLCVELVEAETEKHRAEVGEAKDRLTAALGELDKLKQQLAEAQEKLSEYQLEEARQEQERTIRAHVAQELGAKYEIKEEELETYMFLYEDDRYKKAVALIKERRGSLTEGDEEGEAEEEDPPFGSRGSLGKGKQRKDEYGDLLSYEVR